MWKKLRNEKWKFNENSPPPSSQYVAENEISRVQNGQAKAANLIIVKIDEKIVLLERDEWVCVFFRSRNEFDTYSEQSNVPVNEEYN